MAGNFAAVRRGIAPLQGAEAALVGEGEGEGPRAAHRHRSSDNLSGRPDTMLVWRYIYAVLWLLVVAGDQQARFRALEALAFGSWQPGLDSRAFGSWQPGLVLRPGYSLADPVHGVPAAAGGHLHAGGGF